MTAKVLVCLVLIAATGAVPTRWAQPSDRDARRGGWYSCASHCRDQTKKFQYKPDTTYIYDYSVETETSMAGASEDSAKLFIKARAEMKSLDTCEFALTIRDVRVSHSDPYSQRLQSAHREDELRRNLERNNLRFSFEDGIISNVCPAQDESTFSLNFKRGLLSAFQNSMDDFERNQKVQETDVSGECDTEYKVSSSSWGWKQRGIKITRSKNLVACSKRDEFRSIIQATPYKIPSEIQSTPVIKGSQKCESTIDENQVLQSSSCEETHVFAPFSNGQSGARTKIQQTLTLRSQKTGVDVRKGQVDDRRSLCFEHTNGQEQTLDKREAAEQKLKEICDQTRDDVRPETPRLFSELVEVIKGLEKSDLEKLYRLVEKKTICPKNDRTLKFLQDALPMAGTCGAAEFISFLVRKGEIGGIVAQAWLTTLAFIPKPCDGLIEEGVKLLQSDVSDKAILPLSAMVNNYCKNTPNCADQYYTNQIIEVLKNKIPSYCSVNDRNRKDVLKTLRAIGNVGVSSTLAKTLDTCLKSEDAPLEVRVTAADAYRRFPCEDSFEQNEEQPMKTLKDTSQDSELRIASYLAVMRCPNDDNLQQIARLLKDEEDEQVGSYIYSHLTNLKETSDPSKQELRERVQKLSLKEFDLSPFKYSRNYEATVLINKVNLGVTADSDIIMSKKSPVPRAGKANITFEVFGSAVNALEIGGRVEGLEYLIETMFGPKGYFFTKDNKKETQEKLADLKGTAYARVFGNELFYKNVEGVDDFIPKGKRPNFLDMMIQLSKKQEMSYTHSQQILDVSLIVPTIAGFPLNLTFNGSINLDIRAEGKADLRKMAAAPRSLDIDGEIKASAALEITGTMAVDAFIARAGLRLRNTMHSSTGVKGLIEINRGRILNIEIEPPRDKMEIFSAKSQFFVVHNHIEKEQEMITDNRKEFKKCSGEKVTTIIGVELCGAIQFPNASYHDNSPYYPFTGPSSFSVWVNRRDTHTTYKLFAKRIENDRESITQFLLNTPGSRVNRMISTDLTIGYKPDARLDFTLVSPWKKVNLNSAVVANRKIFSAVGSVIIDDKDKYGLSTEVKMTKEGSSFVYTPFIEVTLRGRAETLLSGQVRVDGSKKMNADLEVRDHRGDPRSVQVSYSNTRKDVHVKASMSSRGKEDYLIKAGSSIILSGKNDRNMKIQPEVIVKVPSKTLLHISGAADYREDRALTGTLTVNMDKMKPAAVTMKAKKTSARRQSKYDVELKLKSSLAGGVLDTITIVRDSTVSSKVTLDYNIPKIAKDKISFNTKFNDKSRKAMKKFMINSNLNMKQNPDYNTGVTVNVNHKSGHSTADVDIKYGPNPNDEKKRVSLSGVMKMDVKNMKDTGVTLQATARAPEKNVDIDMQLEHSVSPNKLKSNVNLKLAPLFENNVNAGIQLQDKSSKLKKYIGQASLGMMGKTLSANTDLTQKSSKQYTHTLELNDFSGRKHAVASVMKMPKKNVYEASTDITSEGQEPIQLQGKTTLHPMNFEASGSAVRGRDAYSVSALAKTVKDKASKIRMEIVHPERQIKFEADGRKKGDKYDGSLSLDWDVKNKWSKINLDGTLKHFSSDDSRRVTGNINLDTPFSSLKKLDAGFSLNSDPSEYNAGGRATLNGKKRKFTTNINVKRPFTYDNAQITFTASTPFKEYKEFELDIDHKLGRSAFSSVKAKVDDDQTEITVQGKNRGSARKNDFEGKLDVKTPFPAMRDLSLTVEHKDDGTTYVSKGFLAHNGERYDADIKMDHSSDGREVVNNGEVKLTLPKDVVETKWSHESGDKHSKSSFESRWDGNKRLFINMDGTNKVDDKKRHIKGKLEVQTPFKGREDIFIQLDHQHEIGKFQSSAILKSNKIDKVLYDILLERTSQTKNARLTLKTPLYDEKIESQVSADLKRLPVTGSASLEWAPFSRIDVEGSLDARSYDDIDVDTKLTTPFRNFENVVVKLTHKLKGSEYVSHAFIDYGIRKAVELESRFRNDDYIKLFRTQLKTPNRKLRNLDTGVQITLTPNKFEGSADLELTPLLGKYDTLVTLESDRNDISGKLYLNTPHKQLQSLQVTSYKKTNRDSSTVFHVQVEPSSSDPYTFDTSYKLETPYHLDVNLKTPHEQLDEVDLNMLYNPTEKGLQSKVRLAYPQSQMIGSELNVDYRDNIDASLVLNTPFRHYRNNKILVRHDPTSKGFNSHAEAKIDGEGLSGDVVYSSGRSTTSGSATLTTPYPGLEKMEGTFKVRGQPERLKGEATLSLGDDTTRAVVTLNNKRGKMESSLAMTSPYMKNIKIKVEHEDKSNKARIDIESSFVGIYGGARQVEAEVVFVCAGKSKVSADLSLKTPFELFRSTDIKINHEMSSDKLEGKASIQTDNDAMRNAEVSYSKTGDRENMVATLCVIANTESLIDVTVETNQPDDELHGKVTSSGNFLPALTAQMDHRGRLTDFNTRSRLSDRDGHIFDNEITLKIEQDRVDIDGRFNYRLASKDRTHTITIHKEGELKNFKVDISNKINGEEVKGKVEFQADDKIKSLAQIENLSEEYDLIGFELEHSGDAEKFLSSAKAQLSKEKVISGKVNFYLYELRRIEATAELSTPFECCRFSKVEYRHEGDDNRLSCSVNIVYGDSQRISSDLIMQQQNGYSMSFNVKTPFEDAQEILISGDYDQSKANVKLDLPYDLEFTMTGVYDSTAYPYHPQFQITTPFRILKKAILSISGDGFDRTADLTINTNDKKIEGNGIFKYENPFSMSLSAQMDSNVEGYEHLRLTVRNTEDAYTGKTSHIEVNLDPEQQVIIDGRYFTKEGSRWGSESQRQIELDIKLPVEPKSISISMEHTSNDDKQTVKHSLEIDEEKVLDMDVTYEKDSKEKVSAVIRNPRPMEFYISRRGDEASKEGHIFVNWDRNEPTSNLHIKVSTEASYSSYEAYQLMGLRFIHPSRTVGINHAFDRTSNKFSSNGKIYWDQGRKNEVTYSVDIGANKHRGDKSYDGTLKLGLPTRNLELSGSLSNSEVSKSADAAFSWDKDVDDTKQVGIQLSMSGQDHTKAEVSVKLPADFRVDSEMILNQGNIIFDGKTDISYSRDTGKTLTLYSKVRKESERYGSFFYKNINGFNYSVELGITHPETKLDVKFDSHVAKSDDLMTSSMGVQYKTATRQMKNMVLFAEIDKIKKQMNVVATGPSKSVNVNGRITREEPLRIEMSSAVDDEDKLKSTLDVDTNRKTFKLAIGAPNNIYTLKASYPNSSAFEVDLTHMNYGRTQDAIMSINIVSPRKLRSSIQYRPELMSELQQALIQQTIGTGNQAKENIREIYNDVGKELRAKYRDVTDSLSDGIQPVLQLVERELDSVANDLQQAQDRLERMRRDNEFYLEDISEIVNSNIPEIFMAFEAFQEELDKLTQQYKESYRNLMEAIKEKLEEMKQYPIRKVYDKSTMPLVEEIINTVDDMMRTIVRFLKEKDFSKLPEKAKDLSDKMKATTHQTMQKALHYINQQDLGLDNLLDQTNSMLSSINRAIPYYTGADKHWAINEVYQQAKWAHKYWNMEQNMKKQLKSGMEILREIVEEEVKEYLDVASLTLRNPVVVFDPEDGVIETELNLPYDAFSPLRNESFEEEYEPLSKWDNMW